VLLWCSLLFAVGAKGYTAELSANPARTRSFGLVHALVPCCAATRRLWEARIAGSLASLKDV
jgi:hypothetical protein